jgi:cell division protein FtsB
MKKKTAFFIFLFLLLLSVPLWAGEELMTKLFFDKWLYKTTSPLELQIKELQATYTALEKESKDLRAQLTTEVKVIIGEHTAFIDGQAFELEAVPLIQNGRTMVPVRFIGEAFGASFFWEEKTRKVTYLYGETMIEIFIDQQQAVVNKKTIVLDTPPFIVAGRTMIPLRFVSEHMGAEVAWDEETRTVTLRG